LRSPRTDRPGRLFRASFSFEPSDIAAPHDFGFQLRHYVVAPEVREAEKLVQIVRLESSSLVKIDVVSAGTAEEPRLSVTLHSQERVSPAVIEDARGRVAWRLGLQDDLRPFYAVAEGDPIMSAAVEHNYGAKGKASFTMFDAVIDVICAQNTAFRRLYAMRANLAEAFGDPFETPAGTYRASPTPEQLAAAPLEAIRACGVGYRDRFIKGVAEAASRGWDFERLGHVLREDARRELMRLPGVGPYTADLALIIGARRQDALFLDVFIREVLRRLYFGGEDVPDERIAGFAEERWGPYRGYAWLYLSTNTEIWARTLGMDLPLRSGALSDPDPA
jgi:N-glycosylase/DNA lyase